jgi:hypothetical protein
MTIKLDEIQLPSDFSAVTDDQLSELDSVAREAAGPLAERVGNGEDLSDDHLQALERLSSVVTGIAQEQERRVSVASSAADNAARASAAAATFATAAPVAPETVAPEAVTPVEPVRAPSVGSVAAAGTGSPSQAAADTTAPARESYTRMVAANTAPGMTPGQEFADINQVAVALEAAMAAFGNLGEGQVSRTNVVQLQRNYPDELRITAKDSRGTIMDKLDAAGREPEGGLVAAAGWCAPSEILYDLFELENGTDGIIDLPELQIHRGGVQVTPGPDFSAIYGGAGYWHQTEAQVIAATVKPTMVIPCPTFTDNRLEVEGVQITGAFLQDRGYPELVARFTRGAMVAHQRKLNIFAINKIANGSTVFDYTNAANMATTTTEFKDLTSLSRLLAIAGTQIMDYRYKYRMGFAATLECVLPFWVIESVRADVQRRMGVTPDEAYTVSIQQLTGWFAERGARLQLVYDWQEALNSTGSPNTATTVGQSAGIYTLPTTVYMLLYAAGTWVRGVADVIRLDTVYDSTNLALNQYIQLFTEDGIQVIKRGFESRMVKTTIDPSGTTSATTNMVTG